MDDSLVMLVLVGLCSIACQYLAFRIKLPAILPLLLVGITVGPGLNILDADALFGDLLFPVVSLSVAIILFEGALTLKFRDIAGHGKMVRNLCSVGCLITWAVATLAAHYLTAIPWPLAFLFGAIVTVTDPTVIAPMLRTVRPNSKIASILRWEGIVIDPIGALLAVLVFEFVVSAQDALSHTLSAFGLTLLSGFSFGAAAGLGLGYALKKHWIPNYLENTAVLTVILGVFAASNVIAHESGLLTVTVTGIVLANMPDVDVDDILEFKETLSVLLISGLFILLATRIEFSAIMELGWSMGWVLLVIMFVARPLSVALSSIGTDLSKREIALLSWIAPRGIVAAAVSALFSLKLEELGYQQASVLVPMVFMVIITTVILQSLSAKPLAKLLNVRAAPPTGFLLFGGSKFSRLFAAEMQANDINVCIADTNWDAIREARMKHIPVYFGNPMSEHASRNLDLSTIGTVLILSPYRQLNPLIAYHFENTMGKNKVWGLTNNEQAARPSHQVSEQHAKKLSLFEEGITYAFLASAVNRGATIKTTRLSEEFSYEDYEVNYAGRAIPLMMIDANERFQIVVTTSSFKPASGCRIISLILPEEE